MIERFAAFPSYLAQRSRNERIDAGASGGGIPALLAHPQGFSSMPQAEVIPAPCVIWLHGRTANKELDPGRYLRWIRAGIAACAIDLPGHGERAAAELQTGQRTLEVLDQAVREIDRIVDHLRSPSLAPWIDGSRVAIGGMSLGGMVTLRRLCEPHPFLAASVEATTGWLEGLFLPERVGLPAKLDPSRQSFDRVEALDPWHQLDGFAPLPLLALHSRADRMLPVEGMERFIDRLRAHYVSRGADASLIEWKTWDETGAPEEHIGFGRFSAEAKDTQVQFLKRTLGITD